MKKVVNWVVVVLVMVGIIVGIVYMGMGKAGVTRFKRIGNQNCKMGFIWES